MLKIFVNCAGGGTSSLFCSKIEKYANCLGKKTQTCFVLDYINDTRKSKPVEKTDLLLAYGGTQFILSAEKAGYIEDLKKFDLVWVCPQTRFFYKQAQQICEGYSIPCELVEMNMFGKMDGQKAFGYLNSYFGGALS
ncbi:MAG: hypothetical protein LBV08_05340 [Clostridiales bacterium]|jgi:cellobiose-specific phosphotransferase system component IIB|nr:hypothetical protein [Clostridiales bacterium]